eukprot:4963908-Prorocentrum_lima.AAC.1
MYDWGAAGVACGQCVFGTLCHEVLPRAMELAMPHEWHAPLVDVEGGNGADVARATLRKQIHRA